MTLNLEEGNKLSIDGDEFTVETIKANSETKYILKPEEEKIESASLVTDGDKIIFNIKKEVEPKFEVKDIWISGKKYMVINEKVDEKTGLKDYQLIGCRIGVKPCKLYVESTGKSKIDFSVYIKREDIKNE
jgi:hypothetical protein